MRCRERGFVDLLDPETFVFRPADARDRVPDDPGSRVGDREWLVRRHPQLLPAFEREAAHAETPLALATRSARVKTFGLRVLVDDATLGPFETGAQITTLAIIDTLAKLDEVQVVGVALGSHMPAYARNVLGQPKIDVNLRVRRVRRLRRLRRAAPHRATRQGLRRRRRARPACARGHLDPRSHRVPRRQLPRDDGRVAAVPRRVARSGSPRRRDHHDLGRRRRDLAARASAGRARPRVPGALRHRAPERARAGRRSRRSSPTTGVSAASSWCASAPTTRTRTATSRSRCTTSSPGAGAR